MVAIERLHFHAKHLVGPRLNTQTVNLARDLVFLIKELDIIVNPDTHLLPLFNQDILNSLTESEYPLAVGVGRSPLDVA
jgi:hypothetical protein